MIAPSLPEGAPAAHGRTTTIILGWVRMRRHPGGTGYQVGRYSGGTEPGGRPHQVDGAHQNTCDRGAGTPAGGIGWTRMVWQPASGTRGTEQARRTCKTSCPEQFIRVRAARGAPECSRNGGRDHGKPGRHLGVAAAAPGTTRHPGTTGAGPFRGPAVRCRRNISIRYGRAGRSAGHVIPRYGPAGRATQGGRPHGRHDRIRAVRPRAPAAYRAYMPRTRQGRHIRTCPIWRRISGQRAGANLATSHHNHPSGTVKSRPRQGRRQIRPMADLPRGRGGQRIQINPDQDGRNATAPIN